VSPAKRRIYAELLILVKLTAEIGKVFEQIDLDDEQAEMFSTEFRLMNGAARSLLDTLETNQVDAGDSRATAAGDAADE
jgi:hypothetical protein